MVEAGKTIVSENDIQIRAVCSGVRYRRVELAQPSRRELIVAGELQRWATEEVPPSPRCSGTRARDFLSRT